MKKLSITATLAFIAILTITCSVEKETPQGVKYKIIEAGDGKVAEAGQVVVIDVSIRDKKDSAWFDSKSAGMPEMIMIRNDSLKKDEYGVMELFRLISVGDSITMTVPARDFFERTWLRPVPDGIEPTSPFTFYLRTTHILDSTAALKMRDEFEMKMREKYQKAQMEQETNQLGVDTTMIDEFIAGKGLKAETTKSGMRFIIKKTGTGPKPTPGQVASVEYSGYLLSGKVFDKGVYSFPVGEGQVIRGWDEIVSTMNVGTSLTVYIPSVLAYGGQRRSEDILENTVLVFDMELKDVKNQ